MKINLRTMKINHRILNRPQIRLCLLRKVNDYAISSSNWLNKSNSGQSTVELAVLFPVVIIIAVIALNATLYFGHCAKFDRLFSQSVTMLCCSPSGNQTTSNSASYVKSQLESNFSDDVDIDIGVSSVNGGLDKYQATLKMHPTLFGMGLKDEIFGVPLFTLNHSQEIIIDRYKPGVFF